MTIRLSLFAAALVLAAAGCNKAPAPAANDTAAGTNAAATAIDGTWKADLATVQIEEQPSVYLLKDGTYSCSSCAPPLTVAADGDFHDVADRPYYDSMAVKVVDDRHVMITRKKGDRVVGETTITTAPDGNTNSFAFKDMSTPGAPPVTGTGSEMRIAPAPAGSHAMSGSWKTAKYETMSDEGLVFTFGLDGDTLNMSSPSGQSYAARLGGPDAPIKGDAAGTMVSVERLSPASYRETLKRDGKVVGVNTMTLTADGKMNAVSENPVQKSTIKYTAIKQ